ncbi:MAG: hypothetical protein LQ351_001930 [Letrouitia transgressa]|nr:MAG: hypothetical protein LQ351_001930 [Letrouitia transgressa]
MSSTPLSRETRSLSGDRASSPPSSPPSLPSSAAESNNDDEYDPKDEAQKEEKKLRQESQRKQKKDLEHVKNQQGNAVQNEKNLKELDWFLSRSEGFSSTVMEQLKQALSARTAETTPQPKLITGGKMRDYQLEGLTWLSCLYQIGLNGILADEMGLGKTVQLISFLAFLREHSTNGPFLILGPLSTVKNWVSEFERWAPGIPSVMYHGNPQTRAQIRRQQLKGDSKGEKFPVVCTSYEICMKDKKYLANYNWKYIIVDEGHRLKNFNCKLVRELKQYTSESRLILSGTPLQNNLAELWSLLNYLLPEAFADLEHFESMFDISDVQGKDGQREHISQERKKETIDTLHTILKPFLLRRVKADVETHLPKKREYILYAPLTPLQKEIYRRIKDNDIRSFLEEKAIERISGVNINSSENSSNEKKGQKRKAATVNPNIGPNKSTKSSRNSTPASSNRLARTRGRKRKNYTEISDHEYFAQLSDSNKLDSSDGSDSEAEAVSSHATTVAQARREVARKSLQNPVMQLRLACNSPHHFIWPWAAGADPDESLVTDSGKMLMLDRLTPHLMDKGHKIILFSQFQRQLDILEEWAVTLRGWKVCRIDGGVSADERTAQIEEFNKTPPRTKKKKDGKDDDVRLFLLSTRAGGLGINLTAADTVILYDSDWNPQLDLQAQDRAHRIGQTRPVIVYRLATKATVEQTLLEKADGKRRLERVVIRRDKFRTFSNKHTDRYAERKKRGDDREEDEGEEDIAEVLEGEGFDSFDPAEGGEVLSQKDLETLTDRSAGAYMRAERGEDKGDKFRTVERKGGDGLLDMA